MDLDTLRRLAREQIARLGLEAVRPALEALLVPALDLRLQAGEPGAFPVGASRMGGLPDLPAAAPWPRVRDVPLTLVAQLRLDEIRARVPEPPLPEAGWLLFFQAILAPGDDRVDDATDDELAVVLHLPPGELERAAPPEGVEVLPWCHVEFGLRLSLPAPGSSVSDRLLEDDPAREAYGALVQELEVGGDLPPPVAPASGLLARWLGAGRPAGVHQLLGFPRRVRLDPEVMAREADDTRELSLLLQLSADDEALEIAWGGDGCLLFLIPRMALRVQDLGQAFSVVSAP